MKIEGSTDIPAPRDRVWAAFLDPTLLACGLIASGGVAHSA